MAALTLEITLSQGGFTLAMAEQVDARALALFGPSGSGKTTVIECIAGLRTPDRGCIAIGPRTFYRDEPRVVLPARERRVGYVPQDVLLFPHMTVRQNIEYGSRGGGAPAFGTLMDLLDLGPLLRRRVQGLSGGERQRVAIARALYAAPDVLLLDEPLAAVDFARRRAIVDALIGIRDALHVPLVYVTHAPEEARALADAVLVLESGKVVGREL